MELGKRQCRHHLDLAQARIARRRSSLRQAGACPECGRDLPDGWQGQCEACLETCTARWEKSRQRARAKRSLWNRDPVI